MKIMIVEDEPTIRELVAATLEKWGFSTVAVTDFQQVLSCFINEQPQLVIMDINLPAFDGFYWCNQIRQLSNVPILFLSSRDSAMDMVLAMNMGGDDFIQKPFLSDVFVAKVNALLRRTYSYIDMQQQMLEHDGLLLNIRDRQISVGSSKLELTRTEFVIMHTLMQHRGSVVSRTKLMRHLWEDEHFIDDNTLTVHMTRLRKKMAELGKEAFITTRKGEGYLIP